MQSSPTLHTIERLFLKAIKTYQMIDDGDSIMVGLSGGKDSLLLVDLLARRSRIFKPRFSVCAIHVRMQEVAYESSTEYLSNFCAERGVPLHIITTSFGTATGRHKDKPACFLCSWNRRKRIFEKAQELGCNKIALGHHMDDIIHTAMMNLFFEGRHGSMPAVLRMQKMPITIIRPLCLVHETDIVRHAQAENYQKQTKNCPHEPHTNRAFIRHVFEEIESVNPEARYSLWHALEREGKIIEK